MVQGVIFDLAAGVVMKAASLVQQEIALQEALKGEIKRLQVTVANIEGVLKDAEKKYLMSNEVKAWVDALQDVAYDADDLLDDIAADKLMRKLKPGYAVTKGVRFFFTHNWMVFGRRFTYRINEIRKDLDQIVEDRGFHLEKISVEPKFVGCCRETHSSSHDVVIGREDDKMVIMRHLLDSNVENVVVVPIVGLGGLGKTTLAQIIYNDEMIRANFELKLWVYVSDVFHVQSIVEKMIECIDGTRPIGNLQSETLKNQLGERINGKRYLLVLDDLWNEDHDKWFKLMDLMKGGARGSKIIVTTRNMMIGKMMSKEPYELKGLSKMDSEILFQRMAFIEGRAPTKRFEKLGKEIAAKCGGVPLAIRIIGSCLGEKTDEAEWQRFKDEEFSRLDPINNIVEILKLSYNHLPSNLKQCFAYCNLFPKGYIFDVSRLTSYWKIQGYEPHAEGKSHTCFRYLLQRYFFQVEEKTKDGEVLKCRMHDLVHDLAMRVAGEEIILVKNNSSQTVTRRTWHVSLHEDAQWDNLAPLLERQKMRTLIVHPGFHGLDDQRLHEIVDKLTYLRVLVLQDGGFENFPRCSNRLMLLRQLDLSHNHKLQILPDSITELYNLEDLYLDYCTALERLPMDMKQLVNLMHLGLEGCSKLEEMPQGIGKLTSLEVLPQFSLPQQRSYVTGGLDELKNLNKLRGKLQIFNLRYVKKGATECEDANLKDKPHLRSLLLHWGRHVVKGTAHNEEFSQLEALQPHLNLRQLAVGDYGGVRFPSWVASLENLVEVRIFKCSNCKSLPRLEGLLALQHLQVESLSELEHMTDYTKYTESTSPFFPSLKTLTVSDCPKLTRWWRVKQREALLPCLSQFVIRKCPNFMGDMPQLPSLQTMEFENPNVELVKEVIKQAKPVSASASTSTALSPLQALSIKKIKDSGSLPLQNLASLKSLLIEGEEGATLEFPWLEHLTSLESLSISRTKKTKSLPPGIRGLTSLVTLVIKFWEAIDSLPPWISDLTSLNYLEINGCPHLTARCGSNRGEDWPHISHIPNIKVNVDLVNHNGIYQL